MKCLTCGTEMKDLFTSVFCPNEEHHNQIQKFGYKLTITGRPVKWETVCPGINLPELFSGVAAEKQRRKKI